MNLTKDNFYNLTTNKDVVIDFFATWCGPCKQFAPIFSAVEQETDSVAFYTVDIDEEPEIAQEFNVSSIPTLVLLREGKEDKRYVGGMPKAKLREFLN